MVNFNQFISDKAELLLETDAIDSSLYSEYDVKRGLRNANGTGVLVGLTRVGNVVGYERGPKGEKLAVPGKLYYRGYSIEELVNGFMKEDRFGYEELCYLLLFGELPNKTELEDFCAILGSKRQLPGRLAREVVSTKPSSSIMNMMARNVLSMYAYDDNPDDTSIENVIRQSIELIAYFPALMAYAYQVKSMYIDNKSLHIYFPEESLSTSENILRMIRPDGKYTDFEAKVLDIALAVQMEHGGGNNSSFTTHLVSSTGTDTYAAIAAALGSLKGPKHGGANISVIRMIDDLKARVGNIKDYGKVTDYLRDVLRGEANDGSGLIYGIGHAIYTVSDPRATLLKKLARELAVEKHMEDDFLLCQFIENKGPELYEELTGQAKLMPANVDLYSGFVYKALDIPEELDTPLFAMARLTGWCAHRLEELISGKKLMRPAYEMVQELREYEDLSDRK